MSTVQKAVSKKTSNINKPASTPQPKSEVSISTKEITPEAGKTKVASQSGAVSGAATSLPSVSAASASASVSNDQNHPLSPPIVRDEFSLFSIFSALGN